MTRKTSTAGAKRIVTLIASATEIVDGLGCGGWLVGRSHECDWPEEVKRLPQLTAAKLRLDGGSQAIDVQVRQIVSEGLSVYSVDAEALKALAPDVIVTQDHCDVCAVSLKDVEQATCDWVGGGCRIISLKPDSLADVYTDIARVADALGVAEAGMRLSASMRQRFAAVRERTAGRARPRLAFIEWVAPLMAGGNWMPELIETAGAVNLFGTNGKPSGTMEWEAIRAADPDVIVVAPCGYDLARTKQELPLLEIYPGWKAVKAVREGRVYFADGNSYFNRPGPRLADTAEILAEILHPESEPKRYEGSAYERHR